MDAGGGFAVELLVDDRLSEGFEGGLLGGQAEGEGAGFGDEFGQFGVGGGERGGSLGGVVGKFESAAGTRAGHGRDFVISSPYRGLEVSL